jgi:hypothetical protein
VLFLLLPAPNNNNSPDLSRNEYRLPTTGSQSSSGLIQRQLPSLPSESDAGFVNREPPPPYWAPYRNLSNQVEPRRPAPRRPAPTPPTRGQINQIALRSRVEQYRNQITVSDSESDDDRGRRRVLSPRRGSRAFKNEVLLGKSMKLHGENFN